MVKSHAFNRLALLLVAALLAGMQVGCKPFATGPSLATEPPPDFSMRITVQAPWRGDIAPTLTPSTYIVQPTRQLHAALGPGATATYFPPPTADLNHEQFVILWQMVEAGALRTDPGLDPEAVAAQRRLIREAKQTEPSAETQAVLVAQGPMDADIEQALLLIEPARVPVLYDVEITAWGEQHHFDTTPTVSPAARDIVQWLAEQRGWAQPVP